jgi:type IV secretion system protein VirB8
MSQSYFDEAQSWDRDLYRELSRSRRQAWIVAGASGGIASLALVALVLLLPLKESVPYVITKDRETGYVEVARAADDASLTEDEALSEFNIVRYVSARETYDPAGLQANYELVYASSSPEVFAPYDGLYRRGEPGNLLDGYGRQTSVAVAIKNVSFLDPDRAFVRFSATRRTGSVEAVSHFAVTLRFRYVRPPSDARDRAKNPLGFQVMSYRRDQEIVE